MNYSHRPVGYLGSSEQDIARAVPIFAAFVADLDRTLRERGPAMERAIQQHILDPIAKDVLHDMAPFAILLGILLFGMTGFGLYYSRKAALR